MENNKDNKNFKENHDNKNKNKFLAKVWDFIKSFAAIFIIVFALKHFVIDLTAVSGHSMDHTLATGDIMLVDKISKNFGKKYKRGDIVIFNSPTEPWKLYVKRVVGLPGENVEIKDGDVYIDFEKLDEDYLDKGMVTEPTSDIVGWFVGEDQYFLLGDNRVKSNDSRNFGPVSRDYFMGEALMRVYPFDRFKTY